MIKRRFGELQIDATLRQADRLTVVVANKKHKGRSYERDMYIVVQFEINESVT